MNHANQRLQKQEVERDNIFNIRESVCTLCLYKDYSFLNPIGSEYTSIVEPSSPGFVSIISMW